MKKMCIISSNPDFLGGVSLYTWDTINELKKSKKYDIFGYMVAEAIEITRKTE